MKRKNNGHRFAFLVPGLGATIRAAREQHDLTLSEAARKIGITRGHLHNLEHKWANPAFGIVVKVAKALAIDLNLLSEPQAVVVTRRIYAKKKLAA